MTLFFNTRHASKPSGLRAFWAGLFRESSVMGSNRGNMALITMPRLSQSIWGRHFAEQQVSAGESGDPIFFKGGTHMSLRMWLLIKERDLSVWWMKYADEAFVWCLGFIMILFWGFVCFKAIW